MYDNFLFFIGYVVITTHITILSVSIFLHRCQTHKAVSLTAIPSHFFRFWLWLTTGMITKMWVAVHRKHHSNVEKLEDPHSPKVHGILKVLFGGVILYRKIKTNDINRYGKGTPNDWLEQHIYGRDDIFKHLGIFSLLVIDIILLGKLGVVAWGIQMVWIPFWAAGVINGVGHFWGYRNYDTPDNSKNICPLGIIIGGEELHNNHHQYPLSAKFSQKWWELDCSWYWIKLLCVFKLAKLREKAH